MELPSIPDSDEQDVILADCEKRKSDDEQLKNLLYDKFAEMVTFFHLVPQANVNINNIYVYCDILWCCHISPNKEYSSHVIFIWYEKVLNAWTLVISFLIPHPVASEHRSLVKDPWWIHSVRDVSSWQSWRYGCHARLWDLHDVTDTSHL